MNPLYDPGRIPTLTKQSLDDYAKHGIPTGDFLRAVLAGDLFAAFHRADPQSTAAIAAIVWYVQNRLPRGCYGSEAAVEAWISERRAERLAQQRSGAV